MDSGGGGIGPGGHRTWRPSGKTELGNRVGRLVRKHTMGRGGWGVLWCQMELFSVAWKARKTKHGSLKREMVPFEDVIHSFFVIFLLFLVSVSQTNSGKFKQMFFSRKLNRTN